MDHNIFDLSSVRKFIHALQRWTSLPIAIIAFTFIGWKLYLNWLTVNATLHQVRIELMLIGLICMIASTTLLAMNWFFILRQHGVQVHWIEVVKTFFRANLTRYIPGGIWHFTGRTLWLTEQGYKPTYAVSGFIWEQATVLATAVLAGVVLSFFSPRYVLIWAMFLFFISVSLMLNFHRGHVSCSEWRGILTLIIYLVSSYSLFWLLYGLGIIYITASVTGWQSMTLSVDIQLIRQAALSWAAGYIAILVPGGWGVREAIFMNFLSKIFPQEVSLLIALLARVNQVIAELVCTTVIFIISRLFEKRGRR